MLIIFPTIQIEIESSILGRVDLSLMYFGVSKRSCPTCASILKSIFHELGKPIQILGTHSKVCPCAFPAGLPFKTTSKVVGEYKSLLKKELLRLFTVRPRTESMQNIGVKQSNFTRRSELILEGMRAKMNKGKGKEE